MRDLLRGGVCRLCPLYCRVDRLAGERGRCGLADRPVVSRVGVLHGEEACLSGTRGSGGVWLTGCNMGCVFCQNYDFNLERRGRPVTIKELADYFLWLQSMGCHNLNWITPTPQTPFLVEALEVARARGCRLPVVYNCGGFESVDALRALEGVVDIYLPDFKYWSEARARHALRVTGYGAAAREAISEMFRQVGHLQVDGRGVAARGLMIRHLVMPDRLEDARAIFEWIAGSLSPDVDVQVMSQYVPVHQALAMVELREPVSAGFFREAFRVAQEAGLRRLEPHPVPAFLPDDAPAVPPELVRAMRSPRRADLMPSSYLQERLPAGSSDLNRPAYRRRSLARRWR